MAKDWKDPRWGKDRNFKSGGQIGKVALRRCQLGRPEKKGKARSLRWEQVLCT